jgi:hypothetical protein
MTILDRQWATPLTAGLFLLMAVTGGLMFFHLDTGLNKAAHEWLGWALVAGAIAHAAVNWGPLKRHLSTRGIGQGIVLACAVVLALSFVSLGGSGGGELPPPVRAMKAVAAAPLSQVAPLTGKPVAQLRADLAARGIVLASDEASIDSATGGDRGATGKAMGVLFPGAR